MMAPTLLHAAMLGVATLGFLSLALGMEDHAKQVFGRVPHRAVRRLMGIAGWLWLIATLAIGVLGFGGGVGPVWALGWATVAALLVVFGLAACGSRRRAVRSAAARRTAVVAPQVGPARRGRYRLAMLCVVAIVGGYGVMLGLHLGRSQMQAVSMPLNSEVPQLRE